MDNLALWIIVALNVLSFIFHSTWAVLFIRFLRNSPIGRLEYERRHAEVERALDTLSQYIHQVNDYMHIRFHDVSSSLQTIVSKLDTLLLKQTEIKARQELEETR